MRGALLLLVPLLSACGDERPLSSPQAAAYCKAHFAAAKTGADTVRVLDGPPERQSIAAPRYFCEFYLADSTRRP